MGPYQYATTFGTKQAASNTIISYLKGVLRVFLVEMMTGEMFLLFKRPRQAVAAQPRHTVASAGGVTATLT